jgi:ATP-dependent helicase HrpB
MPLLPLPVDQQLSQLSHRLAAAPAVILEAPPGSGKTTRVAPWLVGQPEHSGQVILLQPRRVAARAAAERIAAEQGWKLGREVGYQVRFDSRVSADTRLVVATEGILLRRLQSDPLLENVSVVLLDEFHERSLNADLLLGLLRRLQREFRPDLKLIIMSATLSAGGLQTFLDNAPIVRAEGQLYPVDIQYRPARIQAKWLEHLIDQVSDLATRDSGDLLVFLPGVGEIGRVQKGLEPLARDFAILPLHGSLPLEQQTAALFAGARRRIVLATNVAETSLTIEGIRTVVDSGWARVLRFDPSVGIDRLELEPISQASSTQRAGRAGRLSAGLCVRLWDAAAQRARPEFLEPEISRIDLSGAVLQLAAWGESPSEFLWLSPPRAEAIDSARRLLELLGALRDGRITELGQTMVRLPVSPRLARLLIAGHQTGCLQQASLAAAMLSERDPFLRGSAVGRPNPRDRAVARWNCDVSERVQALEGFFQNGESFSTFGEVHRGAAFNLRDAARQNFELTADELGDPASVVADPNALAKALLVAFPDRLARRRGPNDARGLMVGGRGVKLADQSGVTQPELFLCIDVDGAKGEAVVRQASGIEPAWLPASQIVEREDLFFHPSQKQVMAKRRQYWADLVLSENSATISNPRAASELLFAEAKGHLSEVFPKDSEALNSFRNRTACLAEWLPDRQLPVADDAMLCEVLRDLCDGRRGFSELQSAPWLDWLRGRYSQEQLRLVDEEAPERIQVPSGSRIHVEYAPGKPPVLAVRIQEIFSWRTTPRIACGKVPVLLHLLAPNFRPQQITDDLASFWANTYEVVKKELKRRYPKHSWPDDPLTAAPVKKG